MRLALRRFRRRLRLRWREHVTNWTRRWNGLQRTLVRAVTDRYALVRGSATISDDMLVLINSGTIRACADCGYYHAIVCPRVRRIRWRATGVEGTQERMETEYWEFWPRDGLLDPVDVAEALARRLEHAE